MSGDNQEKFLSSQLEKSGKALKIYRETKQALQSEERFVNLFKDYEPASVNSFIEYYAGIKGHWFEHGPSLAAMHNSKNSRWRSKAVNMLRAIFEKKLFNLKCRWVAGEMDLPGIDVSSDFRKWNHNPNLAMEYVEAITEDELSCYLQYNEWARATGYDEDDDIDIYSPGMAMQFFHRHKVLAIEKEEEKFCEWFTRYDKQFGTANLVHLPLTRVELEEDYHEIWSREIFVKTLPEEQQKTVLQNHMSRQQRIMLRENPEKRKAWIEKRESEYEDHKKTSPKYKHVSIYDREQMKMLVSELETPEVQKYYHAYRRWNDKRSRHDRIDTVVYDLKKIKEWIPVQANDDYRDALQKAYDEYSDKKTLEALPFVFEEYKECMALKKPFRWNPEEPSAPGDEMGDRILAARKWKGEPLNFDFLKKENLPAT